MIRRSLLAAAFALSACQAEPDPEKGAAAGASPAAGPTAAAPSATAEPRKVEEKTDLIEFSYSWPAEAAAIPGLNKQLEEELGRDRVESQAAAKDDKTGRGESGSDFFAHSFSKEWRLAGNTPRLLSLLGEASSFTGGAHPNSDYDGVMWDRESGRLLSPTELFADGKRALAALSTRYCRKLDAARAEKRGEALPPSPDDFMTSCPPLADQTVVAADTNGNGRFDMLQLWLPPSVAGPYAEGSYQVDLEIDAATMAALKPEYRSSFERS